MAIFSKIFGDANEKVIRGFNPVIEKINSLEPDFEKLSGEEIKAKTAEFKEMLRSGATLEEILPDAFALTREVSKRTLGQRHYDVQLVGGIILHQGKIAEMKTGEGKTLVATLPLYLNALEGKGCHLITVNDYLAKRDAVWMGQIYDALGLSTGCINHDQSFVYDPDYKPHTSREEEERDELGSFRVKDDFLRPCLRKDAYMADITYGTNNEYGFDYLRDNMAYSINDVVQRDLNFAIVDEVDSILIDEARTPLIISAPDVEPGKMYSEFAAIIPRLTAEEDFEVDEKLKAVTLTETGISKIEKIVGTDNIYEDKGIKYLHYLEQSLKAHILFKLDKDYVVRQGEVIIVDEFTGRLLPGRRYSGGLHQAIEAKEGVKIQPESLTLATVTFQNYFRLYKKLGGMTGTALTSAEEFDKVYKLEVLPVPPNKPLIRKDLQDKIFKNTEGKFRAVAAEIKKRNAKGQPVLIGTTSIEKNEYLGKLLEREGVEHKILNAKNHEKEAEIIAQAGRVGAVTVATNMAGRGVDIILGGNPSDPAEAEKARELGGLCVIGTERHEARRIDNQLRGRAGRQGDPGISQFFVSLDDDLMRIFAGDRVKKLMETFKIADDEPIQAGFVSKALESAQTKIEGFNFDARKHILEYDDVMNKHREVIYRKRREILQISPEELRQKFLELAEKQGVSVEDYQKREDELGSENMRQIERMMSLQAIDSFWMNHLEEMEYLRDAVRLRAYGQQDPLVEYKNESRKIFQTLINTIDANIIQAIMKAEIKMNITPDNPMVRESSNRGNSNPSPEIGRNDPCPCGSGKKYKKCHGAQK